MFFLLRAAFWLGLVLLLVPSIGSKSVSSTSVGASDALSAAGAAVSNMRKFCTRQPDACTVGSQAAAVLKQQAETGAKLLYDLLNERLNATGSTAGNKSSSQNTLKPADLAPGWRGPAPRKDAKQST
jgi:hypothetical protein